jgi:hypothetical protein
MGTPGAWATCSFSGSDSSATWRLGWLALFPRLRVKPDVALGQKIIIFFSINTFNDNKHNNLCTPYNNIFYINSLNYNKNICTANNNSFDINALNYNRNSNIYNTNNSINSNTFNYNKNGNIYDTNNNNNNNNNF